MPDEDDYQQFLPEQQPDRLSIEIPAESRPLHSDRVPTGYEPMNEIQLRGRSYRGLASGQAPWWVLITSWIFLTGLALLLAYVVATASSGIAWFGLVIVLLVLVILGRGTAAKLAHRRSR